MTLTHRAVNPDLSATEKARYLMSDRHRADRHRELSLRMRSAVEAGIDV